MSTLLKPWTTSSYPTTDTLISVDPTHLAGLLSTYSSAANAITTETAVDPFLTLSHYLRGAQASLAIISAEEVLATATDDSVKASATQVIFENSVNLTALNWESNQFDYYLSRPANIVYLAVFTFLFLYFSGMSIKSRYIWFNVTFWCGYGLEFAGFIGRVLAFTNWSNFNYFLLQFISLTIAPAFIMAGIYFTFGQLVVIYGRHYSLLKPLWYTYIFIAFDITSLVVQAVGGAMAASAQAGDQDTGTYVMVAGIAFQLLSMTVFWALWLEFLNRIYFRDSAKIGGDHPLQKRSFSNFCKLFFNTKLARDYKLQHLDLFYNQTYLDLRARRLVSYYPLAISIAVLAIYIRCIYRVVELAQGWSGYLITHEVYIMTLDALFVAICGLTFVPFHPFFVFGKANRLQVKHIRKRGDLLGGSESDADYTDANNSATKI